MTTIHDAAIDAAIDGVWYHRFPDTTHVACLVRLRNGFTVLGQAACIDPARFDLGLGKRYAFEDARNRVGEALALLARGPLPTEPAAP